MSNNLIEDYLDFQAGTESPTIFHRWSMISAIGALLGRRCWVTHGHTKIYPNQYVMLVGEAGCRKSTAIKAAKRVLTTIGYKTIAADKVTKEKLLLDLEDGLDTIKDPDNKFDVRKGAAKTTMVALFGEELSNDPKECYIVADEFNAFLGHSNLEFIDLLTNLWDYEGIYENRIKTGRSVRIPYPTFNILGGNTNVGISQSFPPEVIGQGYFSRVIHVYSDPSGRRIAFPPPVDADQYIKIIDGMKDIKLKIIGEIEIEKTAIKGFTEIYNEWRDLDDTRFRSYSTRRFTHLLKLCQICAAARLEKNINLDTVIYANSIMHYTESFMPKALGEFGKARNSDVSAKILAILDKAETPLNPMKDFWKHVNRDLDNKKQLGDLLQGLQLAGKLQVTANGGILPIKKIVTYDFPSCSVGLLREYLEQRGRDGMPI